MDCGYNRGVNRLIPFALVLLAACGSRPPVDKPTVESILAPISQFEDARQYDEKLVSGWAGSTAPEIRARVALALGRLMKPEVIPVLVKLTGDGDASVRREALFAAGQMGLAPEPLPADAMDVLLQAVRLGMKSPDEGIRARAVEAMGKLALDKAPAIAASFLKDPSPLVRRQAASACFRWRRVMRMRDPAAKPGEMPKAAVDALSAAAADPDAEVRWRAIHALLQGAAKPSTATLTRFLEDSEPLARLFALIAIERLKLAEMAEFAARAQLDSEASVRQASLRALDALDRPDLLFKKLVADPSHHVREAVADLLAAEGPELEALSKDASTAVRAAVLLARARIAKKLPQGESAQDPDPLMRVALVKAAAHLKDLPILHKACQDSEEAVRAAAMVVLADFEDGESWNRIRGGLKAKGVAERGSAVEALGKRKEPEAVAEAIGCFRNSGNRDWVELRESIVDYLGGKPPEGTTPFLLEVARSDTAPSVRQKAIAILAARGVKGLPPAPPPDRTESPHFGRRFASNPLVVMETTKGTLEIECYPGDAPVHVANFIGLVEKGFYDGRSWFRVVPNFVIQGGDALDSGWGDAGWSVRAEINAIPYERGTLGMPRSAGFDTGGCQLFFTHLPTPHLDGYYTVFGKVVKGLDVIDKIEIGDKIVKASLRP